MHYSVYSCIISYTHTRQLANGRLASSPGPLRGGLAGDEANGRLAPLKYNVPVLDDLRAF